MTIQVLQLLQDHFFQIHNYICNWCWHHDTHFSSHHSCVIQQSRTYVPWMDQQNPHGLFSVAVLIFSAMNYGLFRLLFIDFACNFPNSIKIWPLHITLYKRLYTYYFYVDVMRLLQYLQPGRDYYSPKYHPFITTKFFSLI